MAYKNILASSIAYKDHLNVFDKIFATRLDAIDLSVLLVYLIDLTPSSALSNLADQFDVLGYKGWFLTTNDEERRTLIKEAIKRKRYSGTPWAVQAALKSVGYGESEIIEGLTPLYNGTFRHNGQITHGSNGWALFSVENIDLGESKGYTDSDLTLLRNLIEIYKRKAAHLVDLGFTAHVSDEEIVGEQLMFTMKDQDGNTIALITSV